VMTDRKH